MISLLLALLLAPSSHAADPRARQEEAKIRLLKIFQAEKAAFEKTGHYTAEISHFEDSDHGANGPERYYLVGIPDACAGGVRGDANISSFGPTELTAEQKFQLREYFRKVPPSECSTTGFRAFAAGIISGAGADVWSVDEEGKEPVSVRWGLPETTGLVARIKRVLVDLWGSP